MLNPIEMISGLIAVVAMRSAMLFYFLFPSFSQGTRTFLSALLIKMFLALICTFHHCFRKKSQIILEIYLYNFLRDHFRFNNKIQKKEKGCSKARTKMSTTEMLCTHYWVACGKPVLIIVFSHKLVINWNSCARFTKYRFGH